MNINSIEELKQLAGLLKTDPVAATPIETTPVETSSCGCGSGEEMRKYMDNIPFEDLQLEDEDLEEWANSTEHFDGEPRKMDQPRGEIVDISLRRHLNAKGDHVTVDESKGNKETKDKLKVLGQAMQEAADSGDDYTPEKMVESYQKFKNKNKTNKDIKEKKSTDKKEDKKEDKKSVVVAVKDIKENKIVRKKFRDQKTFENWKNSPKSSGYIIQENKKPLKESIDLTQLKKNAGLL